MGIKSAPDGQAKFSLGLQASSECEGLTSFEKAINRIKYYYAEYNINRAYGETILGRVSIMDFFNTPGVYGLITLKEISMQAIKVISVIGIIFSAIFIMHLFFKEIGITSSKKPAALYPTEKSNRSRQAYKNLLNNKFIKKHKVIIQIFMMVVVTRIFIYIMGYLSYALIHNEFLGVLESFEVLWNKWDAPHFISIAQNGYASIGEERYFIVFFPLYPILVRLFAIIIRDFTLSGIIVSNLALCLGSIYLYKLVLMDYSHKVAMRAVFLLLIFPMSFFCGIVYTESLFIMLTIISFYYMRKREWINSGIFGLLAAFTRNFGILLLIPLFIEIVLSIKKEGNKQAIEQLIALISIPTGLGLYLFVNKMVTGDWLKFLSYQQEKWHNKFGFLPENVGKHVLYIFEWKPSISVSMWMPQVFSFLLALGIIIFAIKRIRLSYSAYMLVYLIIAFSPTWLISGPRYVMAMFPLYIVLSTTIKRELTWNMVILASSLLLALYTIGFVNGYHIM